MNILVDVHINNDFDDSGITCAQISLDDKVIKRIFRLAKKAGKHQTIQEFDFYTPTLGATEIDFSAFKGQHYYLDMEKFPALIQAEKYPPLKDTEIFEPKDARIDACHLNVDKYEFWWEGVFKHSDIRWCTQLIPLSFLPKPAQSGTTQTEGPAKPDLEMTAEQMNTIHEKIASGMSHGLNAREIEATFNRHVTKAQLVRCMMELLEMNH